jgi:hypothetical protein
VNICSELEGKVFECKVAEEQYQDFEKEHFVLLARQERGYMQVRFYQESMPVEMSDVVTSCVPNLEDVFLVVFREAQA